METWQVSPGRSASRTSRAAHTRKEEILAGRIPAVVQKELELRRKALEANMAELPQMQVPLQKIDVVLAGLKDLSARQASLTADKQEVTKRLQEVNREGQRLLTFVDSGIREHYGTRSEKLVEFGQQPFRSQPRLKLVGLDGKPVVKRKKSADAPAEPPATPSNE